MLAFSTDHFHCFPMFMLYTILLTRLFAITFVVLFYKVSPPTCPFALSLFS